MQDPHLALRAPPPSSAGAPLFIRGAIWPALCYQQRIHYGKVTATNTRAKGCESKYKCTLLISAEVIREQLEVSQVTRCEPAGQQGQESRGCSQRGAVEPGAPCPSVPWFLSPQMKPHPPTPTGPRLWKDACAWLRPPWAQCRLEMALYGSPGRKGAPELQG